jgi:integrase/recombinase XerD
MRQAWEITREMFLSEHEVDALLDHVRTAGASEQARRLDRLIIECLLFSGLRTSEFCRLALEDTVFGTGRPVFVVRRHGAVERTVFVPRSVCRLVRDYVEQIRPRLLPAGVDANDLSQPLVYHERKRPFERSGLYRRVVRILTAAGLGKRASVQLLRHTYGYLAYLRSGGNLLFVQRQLGHAHPMVTSIYAKFVRESYEQLAERLDTTPLERRAAAAAKAVDELGGWWK